MCMGVAFRGHSKQMLSAAAQGKPSPEKVHAGECNMCFPPRLEPALAGDRGDSLYWLPRVIETSSGCLFRQNYL